MKLTEIYAKKKNVLSFEIFPPKKDDELKDIEPTLDVLCELSPDYISVTFGAGGSSNNNKTIALAKKIKDVYHVEPVVHLTCLCYDRHEIDEFAKQIAASGKRLFAAVVCQPTALPFRKAASACRAFNSSTLLQ